MLSRISRFAARHLACNWLPLNRERGVVSFSFDDAPQSACQRGKSILEQYFARATYYICGSLENGVEQGRPCHSRDAIQQLITDGHEVACHTYSHLNCATHSVAAIERDWNKNRDYLQRFGLQDKGFAFPFGAYSLRSKIAASRRFPYSRLTGGGTQHGRADLHALRAQSLYSQSITNEQIYALISATAESGGWLIFYSHEVETAPGKWGVTPEQLAFAIHTAQESRCRVLPVQDAIQFFRSGV